MTETPSCAPVVGVDLGGTNMQIGVVSPENEIRGRERRKTEAARGADAIVERMVDAAKVACKEAGVKLDDCAAVGVATAGAIDFEHGVVLDAPNLEWENLPFRSMLAEAFGRPVVLENDVNGAIWGEFQLGAARGARHAMGVWVGTGVGGGLVLDGRLHRGSFGTAGEIGHTVLFPDGPKGLRTLEDHASRSGVSRLIRARLHAFDESELRDDVDSATGVTASDELAEACAKKDPLAVDVVDRAADLLGFAIANAVTLLSLERVVLGGGVTEALGEPFLAKIRDAFDRRVFPDRLRDCRLVMTELRADAGLLGAALLARAEAAAGES